MQRTCKDVWNLIDCLKKEASLWSYIKRDNNYRNDSREHQSDNNANDSESDQDKKWPVKNAHWIAKKSI